MTITKVEERCLLVTIKEYRYVHALQKLSQKLPIFVVYKFLNNNYVLYDYQFGGSIVHALLPFKDHLTNAFVLTLKLSIPFLLFLEPIPCGVPHGYILDLFISIIHLHYLHRGSKILKVILYAHDSYLFLFLSQFVFVY